MADRSKTPTLDDDQALIRHALRMLKDGRNPLGIAPAIDALDRVAVALGRDVTNVWPHGSSQDGS